MGLQVLCKKHPCSEPNIEILLVVSIEWAVGPHAGPCIIANSVVVTVPFPKHYTLSPKSRTKSPYCFSLLSFPSNNPQIRPPGAATVSPLHFLELLLRSLT